MRALVQRVSRAAVTVDGNEMSSIGPGLLVFLGIESCDEENDLRWLAGKIAKMRIFADEEGKMNRSVMDIAGGLLVVSQFTLHASTSKGSRPSFIRAAAPDRAEPLYEKFCWELEHATARPVGRGVFGADMKVALVNDGPVTIQIDSRQRE